MFRFGPLTYPSVLTVEEPAGPWTRHGWRRDSPVPNVRGERVQVEAIPSWLEPSDTAAVWISVSDPSQWTAYAFTDEPSPTCT
jgi:hypothetical protein